MSWKTPRSGLKRIKDILSTKTRRGGGGRGGGRAQGSKLASHPAALGSISSVPEQLLMMLRLINGSGRRKVDNGLKILIKPI